VVLGVHMGCWERYQVAYEVEYTLCMDLLAPVEGSLWVPRLGISLLAPSLACNTGVNRGRGTCSMPWLGPFSQGVGWCLPGRIRATSWWLAEGRLWTLVRGRTGAARCQGAGWGNR